jgi:glycine/sarcosine N-methyltransferase
MRRPRESKVSAQPGVTTGGTGIMDAQQFYDSLGSDYDRMVSWKARLAREEEFFQRVFEQNSVHSVLDAACGTGVHAVGFARRGVRAAGADLSPAMIDQARENARAAGVDVDLQVAAFGRLADRFTGLFDAVTCLGNSLPHLIDDPSLAAALTDFRSLLRPGGVLVIQNRNYDRLLRERQRFMPVSAREDVEGETLFLRITDFLPSAEGGSETIEFTLVTLKKRSGTWSQSARTTPLRAMRRVTLEHALTVSGFSSVQVYGSFTMAPYDAPDTGDLVAVAKK